MRHRPDVFDGTIAGCGTTSGTRLVLGMWDASPFGPIADAMIERPDGHRILLAPSAGVADYIAATYSFDEVRVESTSLAVIAGRRIVRSRSLRAELVTGSRTAVGALLRTVPAPVARSRWWAAAIDPVAARMREGVRTVGTAGGGRREYYGAMDEHRLAAVHAVLDGESLGDLRPVAPPVHFGFGSTPALPSIVRVTTTIDGATG